MSSSERVSKYLERIAFHEQPDVSLTCLSRLQTSHQLNVPFENLDVFLGRHIILDVDLLYQKIVLLKRGGWCCELNGMFWWLLTKLGFNVKLISCSHYNEDGDTFDEIFDHLALIVVVAGVDYLVDVGYGHINQHIKPLKVTKDAVDQQVCFRRIRNLLFDRNFMKVSYIQRVISCHFIYRPEGVTSSHRKMTECGTCNIGNDQ